MKDLIESLLIIGTYVPFKECAGAKGKCWNQSYPTHCEHDLLMVPCIDSAVYHDKMTEMDRRRLEELGWNFSYEYDCLVSHRFGSC